MTNIINKLDLEEYLINLMKECDKIFQSSVSLSVFQKDDGSPVSNFDEMIDQLIYDLLKEYENNINIISEEKPFSLTDFSDSIYWLIDPIDGTRSFIKGGKEFTVNIALIVKGIPELGIIFHPPSRKIWIGKQKKLVIYNNFKKDLKKIKKMDKSNIPSIICSRSIDYRTQQFIDALKLSKIERLSSSLKFCYLADANANIYPRLSKINKWDIAAGHAILYASGGEVTDLNGNKIRYCEPSSTINEFVAYNSESWLNYIKKFS